MEVTQIPLPTELMNPCGSNPVFEQLNISCLPEYRVDKPGRMIDGALNTYSVEDGELSLVYDLASFTPSTRSRVIAIEFSIITINTGNIAIVKVMFERSLHGDYRPSHTVAVVPSHFVYMGGTGSLNEWILLGGHIFIAVCAAAWLLIYPIRKQSSGTLLALPTVTEVARLATAILCECSFGIQFGVIFEHPLISANLGTETHVNLSHVAAKFDTVNGINAVIVLLLFLQLIAHFGGSLSPSWAGVCALTLFVVVQFAVVISAGFGKFYSFTEAYMLLTRIGLRQVSSHDFRILSTQGFELTVLLVMFAFTLYWLTGVMIGTFLASSNDSHATKTTPAVEAWTRVGLSISAKIKSIIYRTNASEQVPPSRESDSSPNVGIELASRSPRVKHLGAHSHSDQVADDTVLASIEIMAGRALTEINALTETMERQLTEAREQLEDTGRRVRDIHRRIGSSSNQ